MPASAHPMVSVRLTRTPDRRATSGLKAVARMASPRLVRVNSSVSPTTRTAAKPMTTRSYADSGHSRPKAVIAVFPKGCGYAWLSPPQIMPAAACRAMSTPKVAMIAPEVSIRLTGRSTRYWTITPSRAPATIAPTSATNQDPVGVWMDRAMNVVNIAWPTWAKFTTRVARQVRTRARAISAMIAPEPIPPSR